MLPILPGTRGAFVIAEGITGGEGRGLRGWEVIQCIFCNFIKFQRIAVAPKFLAILEWFFNA